MNGETTRASYEWIEEIVDWWKAKYEMSEMETLISVALQCVEEDKDDRPSMGKVLELLLHHENQNHF